MSFFVVTTKHPDPKAPRRAFLITGDPAEQAYAVAVLVEWDMDVGVAGPAWTCDTSATDDGEAFPALLLGYTEEIEQAAADLHGDPGDRAIGDKVCVYVCVPESYYGEALSVTVSSPGDPVSRPTPKPPPYAPGDALTVTYRGLHGITERPARYVGPYPHGPLPSCVVEYDDGTTGAVFLRDVRVAPEAP